MEAVVSGQSDFLAELEKKWDQLTSEALPKMRSELEARIMEVFAKDKVTAAKCKARPTTINALYSSQERLRYDIREVQGKLGLTPKVRRDDPQVVEPPSRTQGTM